MANKITSLNINGVEVEMGGEIPANLSCDTLNVGTLNQDGTAIIDGTNATLRVGVTNNTGSVRINAGGTTPNVQIGKIGSGNAPAASLSCDSTGNGTMKLDGHLAKIELGKWTDSDHGYESFPAVTISGNNDTYNTATMNINGDLKLFSNDTLGIDHLVLMPMGESTGISAYGTGPDGGFIYMDPGGPIGGKILIDGSGITIKNSSGNTIAKLIQTMDYPGGGALTVADSNGSNPITLNYDDIAYLKSICPQPND